MARVVKRVTWAEAEIVRPGVEAEWRWMCGQDGTCVPPHGREWRLEIHVYDDPRDGKITTLHVIETDPEEKWEIPPSWVVGPKGIWCHPYPWPRDLTRWIWDPTHPLHPSNYRSLGGKRDKG